MKTLVVAPIVEGHGEVEAIRILVSRIAAEILGATYLLLVLKPIRRPRTKLVQGGELARAVALAGINLRATLATDAERLVLFLLVADHDPPSILAPRLLALAEEAAADLHVACVLANPEYETWFVAAAASLGDHVDFDPATLPSEPEKLRLQKAWIQRHWRRGRYSETVDQPALTAKMDLEACRRRSPSFDKLCRALQRLVARAGK